MTPALWILFGAAEGFALFGCWRALQLWNNSTEVFAGRPKERLRAYPVSVFGVASTILLFMALGGLPHDLFWARAVVGALVCAVMFGGFCLSFSIKRWGRPAAVIPPHLRPKANHRKEPAEPNEARGNARSSAK